MRWETVKLWVTTVGFERENVDWIPTEELLNITHYPVNKTIGDWNKTGKLQHEQLCKKQAGLSKRMALMADHISDALILVIPRESDEGEGDKPEGLFCAGNEW